METSRRLKVLNGYTKLSLYWLCWERYMDSKKYDHLSIRIKKKLICNDYLKSLRKE